MFVLGTLNILDILVHSILNVLVMFVLSILNVLDILAHSILNVLVMFILSILNILDILAHSIPSVLIIIVLSILNVLDSPQYPKGTGNSKRLESAQPSRFLHGVCHVSHITRVDYFSCPA